MRTITQKTAGGPEVLVIADIADPDARPWRGAGPRQRRRHQSGRCSGARRPLPAARQPAFHRRLGYFGHRRGDRAGCHRASRSATRCSACRASPARPRPMPKKSSPRQTNWRTSRQASTMCRQALAAGRPHGLARPGHDRRPEAGPARADPCRGRRRRPSRRADRQGARRLCRGHSQHRKSSISCAGSAPTRSSTTRRTISPSRLRDIDIALDPIGGDHAAEDR